MDEELAALYYQLGTSVWRKERRPKHPTQVQIDFVNVLCSERHFESVEKVLADEGLMSSSEVRSMTKRQTSQLISKLK